MKSLFIKLFCFFIFTPLFLYASDPIDNYPEDKAFIEENFQIKEEPILHQEAFEVGSLVYRLIERMRGEEKNPKDQFQGNLSPEQLQRAFAWADYINFPKDSLQGKRARLYFLSNFANSVIENLTYDNVLEIAEKIEADKKAISTLVKAPGFPTRTLSVINGKLIYSLPKDTEDYLVHQLNQEHPVLISEKTDNFIYYFLNIKAQDLTVEQKFTLLSFVSGERLFPTTEMLLKEILDRHQSLNKEDWQMAIEKIQTLKLTTKQRRQLFSSHAFFHTLNEALWRVLGGSKILFEPALEISKIAMEAPVSNAKRRSDLVFTWKLFLEKKKLNKRHRDIYNQVLSDLRSSGTGTHCSNFILSSDLKNPKRSRFLSSDFTLTGDAAINEMDLPSQIIDEHLNRPPAEPEDPADWWKNK